ncbi:MAG: hypothetical protein U1C53_02070 [Candidatus Veblenbacteria bacterium]|nr:hypothetical protein [Candidatus Veblenbacteria bacterium]MDZ4229902.1 hypothetical protein [Candidatus Veblenbacteria bacterium]
MFDQPPGTPSTKPVEDIFAPAEGVSSLSKPQPETLASGPVLEAPLTMPMGERHSSHSWLKWLALAVLVLVIGAGAWYLWVRWGSEPVPAPLNETSQPADQTPVQPVNTEPTPAPNASTDTDGDRLTDVEELERGTDPRRADSDEDGLFDYEELSIYQSNPLQFDTDGDGYGDGEEVRNGYSPTGPGRILELPNQ